MYSFAVACSLLSIAGAQEIGTAGSWLGGYDASDDTFIGTIEAAQRPNITQSATVRIGQGEFNVRANLTDVAAGDGSPGRVAVRSYDLSWNSSGSSGSLVNAQLGSDKLCVTYGYWAFPSQTTNAYQASEDGSCDSAFGEACVQALRSVGYNTSSEYEGGCQIAALPSECEAAFPLGRNEPKEIGDSYNMNRLERIKNGGLSPLPLFYNTTDTTASTYESTNVEGFEFERDRLHFLLLGDGSTESTPVCIRLSENQITGESAYQDSRQENSPGQNNSTSSSDEESTGTCLELSLGHISLWLTSIWFVMWAL